MMFKTERAQFLVENLNLPAASGIDDAVWEHFQLEHLNDDSIFRIESKSRQIAWSFLAAAEAVADAILAKRDSIFTSINHDEAKEKIRYAKTIFENLQIGGLPKLIIENQLELEFDNGARISSHSSRAVRGRPRSNWYGDEFAHVARDREIYKGSLPIVTKGGRVRLGSSPLGASGLFWEIFTESIQPYPDYSKKLTPWWEIQNFCLNVGEASRIAPSMQTADRVEMFGKDRIKAIFANMPTEDFQQEYECHLAETLVKLADGTNKQVIQLVIGDRLVYNCNGIIKECEVIAMKQTGVKDIVRIVTESGTELRASAGHKVKTSEGKNPIEKAENLSYVFTRTYDKSKKAAMARLVAFNLGDGTVALRQDKYKKKDGSESIYKPYFQASFYSKNQEDLEMVADDFINAGLSDKKANVLFKKGSRPEFDSYQLHLSRKPVEILVEHGCLVGKKTLLNFGVPEWIKESDVSIKAEFLAALWGAEGSTPTNKGSQRMKVCKNPRLTMWWKKGNWQGDKFYADLQALHSDCGIETSLIKSEKDENCGYSLYIKSGVENFIAFFNHIGYRYALRKEQLAFLWKFYLGAYRFEPQERKRQVVQMKEEGLSFSAIGKEIGLTSQAAHKIYHRETPKQPLASFPEFNEWIAPRFENNTLSLKVSAIEVLPEQAVYNITVDSPDNSYLLADGLDNYNCIFVDESTAWISWKEIANAQDAEMICVIGKARNSEIGDCIVAIDQLAGHISKGEIERVLYGGMDIGRTKNASELFLVAKSTTDDYPLRLTLTMDACDFDSQLAVIDYCMKTLPIAKLKIDQTGIGRNIAENAAKRYPAKIEGVDFTNQSKQLWATDAKMIFQQHKTIIPVDKDLAYQIHSIKKIVSASKNLIFDTARNEKHHADKFWAFCLALSAAMNPAVEVDYGESYSEWSY